MKVETSRTFRLPKMSERDAAGRLISIPGMVEAEAMSPISDEGVPRLFAKGFRTGFLDIVELKIANDPIKQRTQKTLSLLSFFKVIDRLHRKGKQYPIFH